MRYKKRGRPKIQREKVDYGTKELRAKRQTYETEEFIDGLYRRGLITEQQFWCSNHFRWLYAIRYGVPHIQASLIYFHGEVNTWQEKLSDKQIEMLSIKYKDAIDFLDTKGLLQTALRLLIYNNSFNPDMKICKAELANLLVVLDILVDLWF